jgi:hypothetical protein
MLDGLLPPGLQWYWRAAFFNVLGVDASAKHLEFGSKIPTPLSQMHIYPINVAVSRVAEDATPWAYRDAKYLGVKVGIDPDAANGGNITNWWKYYRNALHPFSSGGAYFNFIMDEGQERIQAG